MNKTTIEWTDVSWNPVTGCTAVSDGCKNCYARRMAARLRGRYGYPADDPFRVTLHPDRLGEPGKIKKPSRIFVCSMGDLFHKDVPFEAIREIYAQAYLYPRHIFIVLTKRIERAKEFYRWFTKTPRPAGMSKTGFIVQPIDAREFPLSNLWLGVSCENQELADERIPVLLTIPAAVRLVSCEPLLGPIDFTPYFEWGSAGPPWLSGSGEPFDEQGWVIAGGETGPGARKMDIEWARSLRDQCADSGVPFFFKQHNKKGDRVLDGREWNEWPEQCKI